MNDNLSPSLIHHLGGSFFRPSYLIEILHGTDINDPEDVWRWSTSQDNISWNTYTWLLKAFTIKGLAWDTKATSPISLECQNLDSVILSVVLNNKLADKPINIWMLYLYDKVVFTSDVINRSGSNTITVMEPIPSDIASTGTLFITGSRVSATSLTAVSYAYTSKNGRTFNISTPLAADIDSLAQIYIEKSSYNVEDAVKVFSGVIDGIDYDENKCIIGLMPETTKTQYTPRRYVNKNTGFNFLPQAGMKFHWGGETFTLERAKY